MTRIFNNMQHVKVTLVGAAVLIATASLIVSHALVRDLTHEEQQSVEVWAEAMRALQRADETTDLGLVLKVLNGNSNIPVVALDENGNVLAARNMGVPQDSIDAAIADITHAPKLLESLKTQGQKMREAGHAIRIELADNALSASVVHVCYSSSLMLQRLSTYPYVQLGVVALFVAVALLALLSSKRAEQNKVWVGLSRETAHQLGTPISSLMAGSEILKETYPDDPLFDEMDKDIRRLQLIAERFSKIGSKPTLASLNLVPVVESVVAYMSRRTSDKVSLTTNFPSEHVPALLNAPLFEWVIENLCKNAIDAMAGQGNITIYVGPHSNRVAVKVSDTGKGIPRKNFRDVFKPGYTTKKRGWGLGLSLAKRIVEEYHKGSIFVESSEPGRGTTFCILLRKG